MAQQNRFENKTILITGGTSGMGFAAAKQIILEGGSVILTGRDLEHIQYAQKALGEKANVIFNDQSTVNSVEALVEYIPNEISFDGLWLNAATAVLGRIEDMTAEMFDHIFAINVKAPFLQMASLKPFLKNGASVVLSASSSVYEGSDVTGLYAASKAAIIAAGRSWARELSSLNIRVNTLVPGPIETNFRRFLSNEDQAAFEKVVVDLVPLGRAGSAQEAANVALFLLSEDSSFVTGSQIAVDGGLIMN